jgi:RNA polymerase sigma factor (sigma-70 family)
MGPAVSQDQFDALLRRLGPDREVAGARYEELRRRLLTVFTYRGCGNAEDLADETMDRVARRLAEMASDDTIPDPGPFIFGVAWNVAREAIRQHRTVALPERYDPPDPRTFGSSARDEPAEQECLDRCLRCLTAEDREVLLTYYQEQGLAKIRQRSLIARELNISSNALRLRIHRLTSRLRECVFHCLETERPGHTNLH